MVTRILEARVVVALALAFSALTLSSASALITVAKAPKPQKGYHLDGFRGWQNGYPVRFNGCAIADKACALRTRLPTAI